MHKIIVECIQNKRSYTQQRGSHSLSQALCEEKTTESDQNSASISKKNINKASKKN